MIVCEVGLNHLGDEGYANEYVDEIIKCKSDAILFHIREKSFYLLHGNEKKILPDEFYVSASKKLRDNNIKFGITIADINKIEFCEKIGVDFYKVLSQDINNSALIKMLMKTTKRIFVSTGMSDLEEISRLVDLVRDYMERFTLVHTQLRHSLNVVNLKAIPMLREKFGINVAFGNHSNNTNVLILALAFEPSDLFFYVKGNRTKNHQDEVHAVRLEDLANFIRDLRELPKAIGLPVKLKMDDKIN